MPAQWMSHLLRGGDYSVHFSSSCLHFQLLQHRSLLQSALFAMEKGCAALFSNRVSDDSGSYTVNLTSHSHSVVAHLTPSQTRQLESEGNL